MTDLEIKVSLLHGQEAARLLNERFRVRLEGFLVDRCERRDEASRNKAVVIANEVIEDCFIKSPSLLERWQGSENLWPFLSKVGFNRLKDYWDKRDVLTKAIRPGGDDDDRDINDLAGEAQAPPEEAEETVAALRCLEYGLAQAIQKEPEALLFMRLKGLHGVEQRRISEVWKHDAAQTTRWIRKAMDLIRGESLNYAEQHGHEVSFRDLERHAGLLLGGAGDASAVTAEVQTQLRNLAASTGGKGQLALVTEMLRNPSALEFFARLLNQISPATPVFVKDPLLNNTWPRLQQAVHQAVENILPAEVRGLCDEAVLNLLELHLQSAQADAGTLWMLATDRSALEAVANPREPELLGKRQPLKSGIISFVLGSGEPILIENASAHRVYSPALDQQTGQATRGMIAVPFLWGGSVRGVLSMVRFGGASFSESDLRVAQRAAHLLALLLESALRQKLLDTP